MDELVNTMFPELPASMRQDGALAVFEISLALVQRLICVNPVASDEFELHRY